MLSKALAREPLRGGVKELKRVAMCPWRKPVYYCIPGFCSSFLYIIYIYMIIQSCKDLSLVGINLI